MMIISSRKNVSREPVFAFLIIILICFNVRQVKYNSMYDLSNTDLNTVLLASQF